MTQLTPGMQQYMKIKNANPDCIILFRMGDFYETFFEDAKTVARELEITLTSRGKGEFKAPLAGLPYHALDPYLAKLVKKGYKVGIVEQIEDPKKAKGLVKRDLVRIITPGTVVESLILEQGSNNYILSFVKDNDEFSISFCDLSTGEFLTTRLNLDQFLNELKRINPAEIIFPMSLEESEFILNLKKDHLINSYDDRFFYHEKAMEVLNNHFKTLNLDGFGIQDKLMQSSSGALLSYLKNTQQNALTHINKIQKYELNNYMYLDNATIRNLELLNNIILQSENSTLLGVLDKTKTPMGKRLIKRWIISPLIDKDSIQNRLDSVEELKENIFLRSDLNNSLQNVYDIERLIARVAYGNANPKDLVALKQSLAFLPKIKELLEKTKSFELQKISKIPDLEMARKKINKIRIYKTKYEKKKNSKIHIKTNTMNSDTTPTAPTLRNSYCKTINP